MSVNAEQFHEGEQRIRARAHAPQGPYGYFRTFMPEQHRELFERLPFMIVGARDAKGQPWATLLEGPPGFVSAGDAEHLRLHDALPAADPLHGLLQAGTPIALLGIEPRTRRRNRANGSVDEATGQFIDVHVLQSFGNCPKYIQARTVEYVARSGRTPQAHRITTTDERFQRIIDRADVFFIATAHPRSDDSLAQHGIDVSHRGGRAGFVRRAGDTLSVDDYVGNNFFNTIGNLDLFPKAGLLFIDMEAGALLHVAARAEIEWLSAPQPTAKGTNRVLHFHVEEAVYVTDRSALRWGAGEVSPFL